MTLHARLLTIGVALVVVPTKAWACGCKRLDIVHELVQLADVWAFVCVIVVAILAPRIASGIDHANPLPTSRARGRRS